MFLVINANKCKKSLPKKPHLKQTQCIEQSYLNLLHKTAVSEYLTCVKNALKDCGSNAEDTLKKAEEQMAQHECKT